MERTEKIKEKDDLGLSFGFSTPHPVKRTPSFYGMELRARMFPFTAEQWQELQRQAMIYKHMVASVPIPTDLLFPGPPTIYLPVPPSMASGGGGGGMSLVRLANGADPEPGRCRRTDGKKWRCARDAAPDQKYCERHLNRGRPRSRKPVEQKRTARSRIPTRGAAAAAATAAVKASSEPDDTLVPNVGLNLDPFRSADPNEEPRCEEWMKSYSEGSTSRERCEMMHPKIGLKYGANPAMQHYEELPNLNYSETSGWYPFLSSNLSSVEESNAADYLEPPRRFFDAWSSENSKQHISNLTLSISNDIEEGTEEIHDDIKSGQLNWMASNSPLGGPLAEVLHSSNLKSQESSPRDSPSRLVSSPSGVLQKPLVSLSDSSRSSSPTFAAASRSEFALHWMNLNN